MKIEYTLRLTVGIDIDRALVLHGERWAAALEESSDEFAEQLNQFINEHPFVVGCELKKNVEGGAGPISGDNPADTTA